MKKILTICGIIMCINSAKAVGLPTQPAYLIPLTQTESTYIKGHTAGYYKGYNNGYKSGYRKAKADVREKIVKATMVVVATALIGSAVYQLGRNSRWTATENGLTYRF